MATWFTSDTHFGHEGVIGFCARPFASVEEMDAVLLDNINSKVGPRDTLYHLGDFSWRTDDPARYRAAIKCKNLHLILGNHDPQTRGGQVDKPFAQLFSSVEKLAGINVQIGSDSRHIVLCHYAMRVWNKSHHGSWHLYGHSHGDLHPPPFTPCFDVGVDAHKFQPLSLSEVVEIMKARCPRENRDHVTPAPPAISPDLCGM